MWNRIWKARGYRYKILLLLALSMIPIWAIVTFHVLPLVRTSMYEDRKDMLQNTVDIASKVIEYQVKRVEKKEATVEEAQKAALEVISHLRYDEKEYFWINDMHPKMVMHPIKPELNGKDLTEMKDPNGFHLFVEFVKVAKTDKGEGFVEYLWPKPGSPNPEPKLSFVRHAKDWQWVVGSGVYIDDVETAVASFRNKILISFLGAFALAFIVFYFFAGKLISFLTQTVEDTNTASHQVLEASSMLSSAGQSVAQGAVESAEKIEQTLQAIDDLKRTVEENKSRSQNAAELARESESGAGQGAAEIKKLIDAISDMAERTKEITSAMDIIDDIAFQTNLLALNAAVEAARAGEQGKGFAVVAEAVRALALKSAQAAKEVKATINGSVEQTHQGLVLARASDKVLDGILVSVQKVNVLNQEIAQTTHHQAEGIHAIHSAMGALEKQTQAFSAAAEETAATSEEMSAQANTLKSMVNNMAREVTGKKSA